MTIMKKFLSFAVLGLVLLTGCSKGIDYVGPEPTTDPTPDPTPTTKVPNSFDFSTVQKVKLNVDYSEFKTYGPVFFGVYTQNPFVTVEDAPDDQWNEAVTPIFEDYTGKNGKYSTTVELPTYAQHLYIATGNFFTGMHLMEADVQNGAISAVAKNENVASSRAATRSDEAGVPTDDLSKLKLSQMTNGTRIYKDWKNWLGKWDSESGYPTYMLDKTKVDSKLIISDDEMENLYSVVGTAFKSGSAMNKEYCSSPDLLLEKDSEVTFTVLGSSTCWKSTLGYYYYTDDNKPTTPMDMNIIMVFPNTQDGNWARAKEKGLKTYNGIGVHRGDVVQLMYYPHIADNDMSEATKTFPKGTRIGFILKTQGWAMQGKNYSIKYGNDNYYDKKYNTWCATTDGLSYCSPIGTQGSYLNPNGESRGAKFSCKTSKGTYTIVSFEDAMDDQDFDDLIFALKPVDVFAALPEVETRKSSTNGVYAFEDLWPKAGDYDLNDALVNVKHEKEFNTDGKIIKETFYLTTYQNYVTLTSGLALTLNTKKTPQSVAMKKMAKGSTEATEASFTNEGNVYYLTADFKGELGTTYILELTYQNPLESSADLASIKPFIYRSEGEKNWEVHIPMEAPTAKMNYSYFGTEDDCSDPSKGLYFVRQGDYPFAFYLHGVNISVFENTILKRENESKRINELFPDFLKWSTSNGATNKDWYLK